MEPQLLKMIYDSPLWHRSIPSQGGVSTALALTRKGRGLPRCRRADRHGALEADGPPGHCTPRLLWHRPWLPYRICFTCTGTVQVHLRCGTGTGHVRYRPRVQVRALVHNMPCL